MRLPSKAVAVTALNFGRQAVEESFDLGDQHKIGRKLVVGRPVVDILRRETVGSVSDTGMLAVKLGPLQGTTLVIQLRAEEPGPPVRQR